MPVNDTQLEEWSDRFAARLIADPEKFGLDEDEIAVLAQKHQRLKADLAQYRKAQAHARAATTRKKDSRDDFEALIRPLVTRIQVHPTMTNEDRAELGIPLKNIRNGHGSLEFCNERPSAIIEIRPQGKHIIRIHSETDTGPRKAKPAGATGCEIWVKVGDLPNSIEELRYVETVSKGAYVVQFKAEDVLKQAHYRLRWVGRNGVKGDWAEIDSATIAV